jgi:hypothetical protein
MLKGKLLRQALDKFLKNSEVSQNARVQVCLPNGELYDVVGIQLVSSDLYKDEKLYEGKDILQLAACGLRLEACRSGLDLIYNYFKRL